MKRLNKIYAAGFLAICMIAAMSSCDLDRMSLNGPSTEGFPANLQDAQMGLYEAYQSLSRLDAASTPFLHVMDNITDIGYARPGTNYTSPITSAITTDNALVTKPWEDFYKTIADCHAVLDGLGRLQGSISDQDYKQIDAELRFIRAYAYSKLIEFYGDVPLLKHKVNLDSAEIPRTPKSEIQQFILDELTAIADNLPVSQQSYGNVRASGVAAYMLKARVALYAKKYQEAAAAADKAITLSQGVFELTPFNSSIDYAGEDYTAGEPDISNIFGHEGFASSKEWIWVYEYNQAISGNTHNQQYFATSRLAKGCSYWGPTQDMINTFECGDGLPITESPSYDPSQPFKDRDPRLDMYCARPHARFMGYQFEPSQSFSKVYNYWPVMDGTGSSPALVSNSDATNAYRSFSGYYWRKDADLADVASTSSRGVSDLDVGVFRYAELLLIYAEAKIEANDIDKSVYEAINQIRKRAHMPDLPTGLTQKGLRKALRYERKVELCGEGFRWYDLRRWGIANSVMNGDLYLNRSGNTQWSKGMIVGYDDSYTPLYNKSEATKYFTTQPVVFNENKDELWPVPKSEMDANKNLVQNPGY